MTPDQMRDASLLELFRLEAEAQKQVFDSGLLTLERDPINAGQLEACMRAAHSLKGAARIVGLDNGVQVAHVMEDMLVAAQEHRLRLSPEHIDALLQGSDLLLRIGQAQPDEALDAEVASLTSRLRTLFGQPAPAPIASTVPSATADQAPANPAAAATSSDTQADERNAGCCAYRPNASTT